MIKDLSKLPPTERKRRQRSIQQLTDPDFILASYLLKQTVSDNPIRDGFVPIGSDLRDFSIVRDRGRYHVFYLDLFHRKHTRRADNPFFIAHASTRDFMNWDLHEPALQPVAGTWDAGRVGCGYAFPVAPSKRLDEVAGIRVRFVMMYLGYSRRLCQSIGMAFSDNLTDWVRYDTNPVFQPVHLDWAEWSRDRLSNCRDPHVLKIGRRYMLYYTALQKDGDVCIAAADSTDLQNWRDLGPVIHRSIGSPTPAMLESSCVHALGRNFVLTYTHKGGTWLSVSDDPLHFEKGRMFVKGYWGMEQVRVKGNRWLVAFFRKHTHSRPGALFLGVIAWRGTSPSFKLCRSRRDVAPFL